MSCLFGSVELSSLESQPKQPQHIQINNRILAKVNGKAISTYDVTKKLDMHFYREFPEYLDYLPGRYQFYNANWRTILEELINKELILADAQEHKIEVTNGDIRQEIESAFGPNIIANLDKAGMNYDEAAKIMQGDIIIQRVLQFKVNAPALRTVTPSRIRKAYEEYIRDPANGRSTQWIYQVVTIRDRTAQKSRETAERVHQLLKEEKVAYNDLLKTLKERKLAGRKTKVTVSADIKNHEGELSESYKEVLQSLEPGMISEPNQQKSRQDNATVYRIFILKEKIPGGVPSYKEMESRLKEKLLNEVAGNETEQYLKKLKQHFHFRDQDINETIPSDYQPYVLK